MPGYTNTKWADATATRASDVNIEESIFCHMCETAQGSDRLSCDEARWKGEKNTKKRKEKKKTLEIFTGLAKHTRTRKVSRRLVADANTNGDLGTENSTPRHAVGSLQGDVVWVV